MEVKISDWGRSSAIRIPKDVMKSLDLNNGQKLNLTTQGKKIILEVQDGLTLMKDWNYLNFKEKEAIERYYREHIKKKAGGNSEKDRS